MWGVPIVSKTVWKTRQHELETLNLLMRRSTGKQASKEVVFKLCHENNIIADVKINIAIIAYVNT